MTDVQIKAFLVVADKKSFTKAASELFLSQPNISRSISALEKELGVALFDRTYKQIQLTEAGEIYYDLFKRFQLEFSAGTKKARILNYNRQGNIRLGYLAGWQISTFMPDILKKFSEEYPGLQISIECYGFKQLCQKLISDELDVIISMDDVLSKYTGIRKRAIAETQRLIIYSEFHGLADKQDLTPYDFRNEIFYVMGNEEADDVDTEVRKFCEPYGFVPQIKFVKNTESMLASVQNGLGVAFYDDWGWNINANGFKYISLDAYHKVSIAWNANSTNVAISVLINEINFIMRSHGTS